MESMENIFSPRSLNDDQITFRTSRSFTHENGNTDCHEVLKMELVVHSGDQKSAQSKTSQTNYHKNSESWNYGNDSSYTQPFDLDNYSFRDDIRDVSDEILPQVKQTTVEDEQHIAHRKCKKRICDFCRPKVNKFNHNPKEPTDSTLFFRWEKTHNKSQTPSVSLRKVKYTVNDLGQVSKVVDKKARGKVKESTETIKSKIRVKLDTLKAHRVIARLDQDGLYYPAVVVKCPDPRHAIVSYDAGSNAQVLTRNIILTGGAVARPQLQVGDYVMMRVVNLDSNEECYVPAMIQNGPQKMEAQAKFYSVIMYNGQKASTLRTFLVKISKERFELASMYICLQQHEDKEDIEDIVHVTPRRKEERKSKKEVKNISKLSQQHMSYQEQRIETENANISSSRHSSYKEQSRRVETEKVSIAMSSSRLSRHSNDKEERVENETASIPSSRHSSIQEESIQEENSTNTSPRYVNSKEQSIIEENIEQKEKDMSSRSATSIGGRIKEHERLLKEIKEREEKQEHMMQKLKRKAKKLAKRERKLEAKRTDLYDEQGGFVNAIKTPCSEMSADEEEFHSKEEENQSPSLLYLRKSSSRLRPGEEVLARWSDDGWYYRGIVKHDHGDYSYNLEDSTGLIERIWREDIISEDDSFNQVVEIDSKVIALHPDFSFSYAPGTVIEVSETSVEINFYDGQISTLPRNEVYHSSIGKYDMDVAYILKQERRLIGAAVIARDDRNGTFYPGSVIRRAENGVDYVIGWTDGTEVTQKSIYIFSAFTRRPPLSTGDRVLALADPIQVKFLPGYLLGSSEDNLIVKFCDGETSEDVNPASCYWLGKTYYDHAVEYFKAHDSSFY